MAEPPSSPPNQHATAEESLSWYKKQYEQLCDELSEFRESSHELEAELEKDLDAADKRQRELERKVETVQFEADEWKEKCKKAKAESNAAQNALEKEITTLRDANRSLHLKLRDIEVANDDFERQARNTTSSLEDMESKYNVAIERAVMMEEEVKIGEQERETLRIEAQRLREELSDLKIEAEIMQDKIKKAEHRHLSAISTDISVTYSDTYEDSPRSTASSPMITTPPDELSLPSVGKLPPALHEPPSPPMSDASIPLPRPSSKLTTPAASSQKKSRIPSADRSITPKPRSLAPASVRQPGLRSVTTTRPAAPTRTAANRATSHKIPPSTSLTHIRSLTAQMQRLEARVQSARSKLPAPAYTPPRSSPRSLAQGGPQVPPSVTMRSRKRTVSSIASSVTEETPGQAPNTAGASRHVTRLSSSGVSRLSFGTLANRSNTYDPDRSGIGISRPSSRASVSGYARPERPPSRTEIPRPVSRTSFSGMRTPMGVRPRSSMSGAMHGHSHSIGRIEFDEMDERMPAPGRRNTYGKSDADGNANTTPAPSGLPLLRRQSGEANLSGRRISGGRANDGGRPRKLSDLGETY
ncbi:putative nuclear distribution protein nudE [Rosellinia necatrix]|uniref:Putative nuclear distribution protein nudE n=1 Tax=Rosellinia necatrix TaxID=77044 RepID=A0A1W2TRH4_ROSNE|nr:putative nuclear distribution protein nudE [Rosellinia necatrix]